MNEHAADYMAELEMQRREDPIVATANMTMALMRGDPRTMKLGYSIGNALIAAASWAEMKSTTDLAIVAERVVDQTTEHYSATKRPLIVAICDGGLVQDDIRLPGLGEPEFEVLDFDREGEDPIEGTFYFVQRADRVFTQLRERGANLDDHSYWLDELEKWRRTVKEAEANPDWPVDHAEGE